MNQVAVTEVEAKYRITNRGLVSRLQSRKTLGRHYQLGPAVPSEVVDIYVDTNDARLLRAGYALRLRQKGERRLVTLKALANQVSEGRESEGPLYSRYELELPLSDAATLPSPGKAFKMRVLPDDIQEAVIQITGKKPMLSPLCTIKQTRHERLIEEKRSSQSVSHAADREEGATSSANHAFHGLAVLSIDEVAVFSDNEPIEESARLVSTFAELEAELLPGHDIAELVPIAEFLAELEGLTPAQGSKFMQAIVSISRAMPNAGLNTDDELPQSVQATTPIAEALRLVWREQSTQLLLLEAGLRRDNDVEYVHQMRVAIRRMRAAYMLLGQFFTGKALAPLMDGLKRTAKALGRVRDLDVALATLGRYRQGADAGDQEELQPLLDYWRQQRAEQFTELLTWLDSKSYRRLLSGLREFVDTPELGVKDRFTSVGQSPEAYQIRHVLPGVLLERFLAVRKYEALFDKQTSNGSDSDGGDDDTPIAIETLHALRIECKYLRYTLEFVPTLLGQEGEDFVKQLKKLQNLLGDLNDASVAKEMLSALPKEARTKAVKQYTKKQDKILHRIAVHIGDPLRAFLATNNRTSLGVMLSRI